MVHLQNAGVTNRAVVCSWRFHIVAALALHLVRVILAFDIRSYVGPGFPVKQFPR
jgi:hypothetical protein